MSILVANKIYRYLWSLVFWWKFNIRESAWDHTVNMKFNVFYSTFTTVFFKILVTFLRFFNVFLLSAFLHLWFWVLGSYQEGCTLYTGLMLSINGVSVSCRESNGTPMCRMMMWDGKLSNHTFRLLFKHGASSCSVTLCECQTNQMPSRS